MSESIAPRRRNSRAFNKAGTPEPPGSCGGVQSFAQKVAAERDYRIEGPAFIYSDRQARRVSTILGYPTHLLASPS